MKNLTLLIATLALVLGFTHTLMAQNTDHSGHSPAVKEGHGESASGSHAEDTMTMLGTVTTDGIKAMAHLQKLNPGATRQPDAETHNFMVIFETQDNATPITQGRVAVKVTGPDGKTGNAMALNPKDGYFNTTLNLAAPGKYTFQVGTKLVDDKVRQFGFGFELK